ncbi:MAG: class I SAM-dependent methyltransferase [Thermoleophilia bacterium]|nr:class I SAM-dependent methyltransferase [Thermoleophilia bacterium]
MDEVLRLYAGASPSVRAFLRGRVLLSDLDFIESQVPVSGTVVDLGCGHGLFANLLALRSPNRNVVGIDLAPEKIEIARATIGRRENIDFISGDVFETGIPECDAITIVDVLYLLPRTEQYRILEECRRKIRPGGLLVWKAQERRPRWKFAWTWSQEMLTTSTGVTRGRRGRLTFLSREEAAADLKAAGFRLQIVEMKSWRPYSDILYLGS